MVQNKKLSKGFTLIELIIVITIIALFSGMLFAYYGNFNEEKKLQSEVKKITAIAYLARSKATAGDLDLNLPACSDFLGYRININSSSTYALERNCGGTYVSVQTQTLPTNTTITSAIPLLVLFKPLSAGTDLSSPTTVVIKDSFINRCMSIQISTLGVITENAAYAC